MALPTSGPLGISDIRTELGTSNGSLRDLSDLAGFTTPDAMSEFYGYSAVTTVDLAGRITFDQYNQYFYQYVFPIVYASGDHTGSTQLYVELTVYGYNYYEGRTAFYDVGFQTEIFSFQASDAEFALRVDGIQYFNIFRIESINFWGTSSTETVNLISLTT